MMKKAIFAVAGLIFLIVGIWCVCLVLVPIPPPNEILSQAKAAVTEAKIEAPNIEQLIELWNQAEKTTSGAQASEVDDNISGEINQFFGIGDSDELAVAIDKATSKRIYENNRFVYLIDDPRLRLIVLSNLFVNESSVWKDWSHAQKDLKLSALLKAANKLREERSKARFKPDGCPAQLEVRFVPQPPNTKETITPNDLTEAKVELVFTIDGKVIQLATKPIGTLSFLNCDNGKFVSNSFDYDPKELPFLLPPPTERKTSSWTTEIITRFSTKTLALEQGELKLELEYPSEGNGSAERKKYSLCIEDERLIIKECQKILEDFQKSAFVESKLKERISTLPNKLFKEEVKFESSGTPLSFRAKRADFLSLELDQQDFNFQLGEYNLSSEQATKLFNIDKLLSSPQLTNLDLKKEDLDFRITHDDLELRYTKGELTSGWMQIKQQQSGQLEITSKQKRQIVGYQKDQFTGAFSIEQGSWELYPDKYSSTPIASLKSTGRKYDESNLVEYLKTRLDEPHITFNQEKATVGEATNVSLSFRDGELDIASLASQGVKPPASLDSKLIDKLLDEVRKIIPVSSSIEIQPVEGRFISRWENQQLDISCDFLLTFDDKEMAKLAVTGRWNHENQNFTDVKVNVTASKELLNFFDLDIGPFAAKPEKLVFQNGQWNLALHISIISDFLCEDFTGATSITINFSSADLFDKSKRRTFLLGAIQQWIDQKPRMCTYEHFKFELGKSPSPPPDSELCFQIKLSHQNNHVTLIGEVRTDNETPNDIVRITVTEVDIQEDSCQVIEKLVMGMIFVWDQRQLRLDHDAYKDKLKNFSLEEVKKAWTCLSKKFWTEELNPEKLMNLGSGSPIQFNDFALNSLSILPFDFEVNWTATGAGVSLPITYRKSKQFSFGSLTIEKTGELCQQIFDYLIKPHIFEKSDAWTWESINQVLSAKKIPSLPVMGKLPVRPKDFYSDKVEIGTEGIKFANEQSLLYFNAEIDFDGLTYELFTPENSHQRAFRINQQNKLEISSFAKLRPIDNGNGRSLFSGLEALDDCLVAEWKIETEENCEWITPDKIRKYTIQVSLSSHGLHRFLKSSVFSFLPEDAVKSAVVKLRDGTSAKLGDGSWTFQKAENEPLTQLYLGTVNLGLENGSPVINRNGIESIELELNDEKLQIGLATIDKLTVTCGEGIWNASADGKLKLSRVCDKAYDVDVRLENIGILPRLDLSTANFSADGLSNSLQNCAILDLSWISTSREQAQVEITPTFSSLDRLDVRVKGKTSFFEHRLDFDFEFGIRRTTPKGIIEFVNKDGLPLDQTLVRTMALSQIGMKLKELSPFNLGSELSLDLVHVDFANAQEPSATFRVVSSKFELDETLKVSFPIIPDKLSRELGNIVQRKLGTYLTKLINEPSGNIGILEKLGVMNAELSIQPVDETPIVELKAGHNVIISAQLGLVVSGELTIKTKDNTITLPTEDYPGFRAIDGKRKFLPIVAFDGRQPTWVDEAKNWWLNRLAQLALPDSIKIPETELWAVNEDGKWSIVGEWKNDGFKVLEQSEAENLREAANVFRLSDIQFRGSIEECKDDIFKAVVSAEKCQNAQYILMAILPGKSKTYLKDLKVDFKKNHFIISGQLDLPGIGDYRFRNLTVPLKASREEIIKALLLSVLESWQGENGGGLIRLADDFALRFNPSEMTDFLYNAFENGKQEKETTVELQTSIDGSDIRVKATLKNDKSKFNIEIDEESLKKQLATLGIQRLLDGLNGLFGDSFPLTQEHRFVTNQRGTIIAVEIDVSAKINGVGKLEIKGTRIGKPSRGPTYAQLTVSVPIPIPPAFVIYDPSVTIDLSKKEEPLMKVEGKLTSPEETTGKIVHFAGEVSITLNKAFTIKNTGNLVLADRFSVATTTGTISPSVGELEQRLETNKPMSQVIDINGHLVAKVSKNLGLDAKSEMTTRLLKKDLNSTILKASTRAGTFEFHNRIDLKIAKSDLLLTFEDGDFLATTHLEVGVKKLNIGCDVAIRRSGVQVEATVTGVPIRLSFQDLDDLDDNLGKLLDKLTDPKFSELNNMLKKGPKKKGKNDSPTESDSKPNSDTPQPSTPPNETAPSTRPPRPSDALPFPRGSNAEIVGWPVKLTDENSKKVVWTKPADDPNAEWSKLGTITNTCPDQAPIQDWQFGYSVPMQNNKWQIMLMRPVEGSTSLTTRFIGESGDQITMREVSKDGIANCEATGIEHKTPIRIVELSPDKSHIRVIIDDQSWVIPTKVKLPVIEDNNSKDHLSSLSLPILDISDCSLNGKNTGIYKIKDDQYLVIPKKMPVNNGWYRGLVYKLGSNGKACLISIPLVMDCDFSEDHERHYVFKYDLNSGWWYVIDKSENNKELWRGKNLPKEFPQATFEDKALIIKEIDTSTFFPKP